MMKEPEMLEILRKQTCCGKPCKVIENGMCNPYNEVGGMALCLKCGNVLRLMAGQLDKEEVDVYREGE
jgi:hypothetical protein